MTRGKRAAAAGNVGAGICLVKDLEAASFGPFLLQVSKRTRGPVEGIRDLTRQQLVDVCKALERHVRGACEWLAQAADATMADADEEDAAQQQMEDTLQAMRGAALLAHDLLVEGEEQPPEQLLSSAVLLHDYGLLMLDLPEVSDCVAKLCCAWWERKAAGREALVSQTTPYVLMRAVGPDARAADVKQCFALREALGLLDFADPSITDTKRLMLLATFHPQFLARPEGRRFVASLFAHEPGFVKELAAIVRNQVPACRKGVLEAYGDIVLRAWRDTTGPCAYEVETELLQGLAEAALLASTPAIAAALRTVLEVLHAAKPMDKRLDAALCRLYGPILFRAFGAANAAVRLNALQLLLAAFPVLDPDAAADEAAAAMTQQMGLLRDCLSDPCPKVREAAATGICRLLNNYWEIIPAATSALFIKKLTGELAFDQASIGVRAAAVEGLRLLVSNPNAKPVLKKALPELAPLLGDPAIKVREALALLLVSVSASRSLHFYDVVPVDRLLHAMGHDLPPVARRMQQILLPSYFPNAEEGAVLVAGLLRANPTAGQAFCRLLVNSYAPAAGNDGSMEDDEEGGGASAFGFTASVPLEGILQLAVQLKSHLLASAPRLAEPAEAPPQPPAAKRPKATAGSVGAAGTGRAKKEAASGKRRKQPAAAEAAEEEADGADAGDDRDQAMVVVEEEAEDVGSWCSILAGLALLCRGIGGAVASGRCSEEDAALAFERGSLEALAGAVAGGAVQRPDAMRDVMSIASSLHFTPAAQRLRAHLFEQLEQGSLPGLAEFGAGGTHSAEAQQQEGVLLAVLEALATGATAPKLAAMLMTALGARDSQPIRKPAPPKKAVGRATAAAGRAGGRKAAAEGEGGDVDADADDVADAPDGAAADDIRCGSCHALHPEHNMLLCDGCDASFHTQCLRPPLAAIPSGDWFCGACEVQIQAAVGLPRATAAHCFSLLARLDAGRQLMLHHLDTARLLEGLQTLAQEQAEDLVARGSGSEADSGEAAAPPQQQGGPAAHDAMGLMCRLAVHLTLTAFSAPVDDEDDDDEARSEAGSDRSGGSGGGRARAPAAAAAAKQQRVDDTSQLMGAVLSASVDACTQLSGALQGSGPAACSAALAWISGMLKVLADVQRLQLLDCASGEHAARVCAMCSALVHLCAGACAGGGGANDGGGSGAAAQGRAQQNAGDALLLVLRLATQLAGAAATAVREGAGNVPAPQIAAPPAAERRKGGDDDGADDAEETSQQQLEERLNAAQGERAAGAGAAPPSPAVAIEGLVCLVLEQLCAPATAGPRAGGLSCLAEASRKGLYALARHLLELAKQGHMAWLKALCSAVGSAAANAPQAYEQLLTVQDAAPAGPATTAEVPAPAADATAVVRGVRGARGRAGMTTATAAATAEAAGKPISVSERLMGALKEQSHAAAVMADVLLKALATSKASGVAASWLAGIAEGAYKGGDGPTALGAILLVRMIAVSPEAAAAAAGGGARAPAARAAAQAPAAAAVAQLQRLVASARALQPLSPGAAAAGVGCGSSGLALSAEVRGVISQLVLGC